MDTEHLVEHLSKVGWVALATADGDQPRVRMMTIIHHDGQLWCYTSSSSAKASHLKSNRRFEFVAHLGEEGGVSSLRATGLVEIIEDSLVRRELAGVSPSFKEHWSTPDDPDFMLLRLDVESVETERGPATKPQRFAINTR